MASTGSVVLIPISRKSRAHTTRIAFAAIDELIEWLGPAEAVEIARAALERAELALEQDKQLRARR